MAPEQWKAEEIGPSVDIWALGLILYEMLVGHHPYDGMQSVRALASSVTDPKPIPMPTSEGHFTFDLLALLESCLAKKAADRPTAAEVYRELNRQTSQGNQEGLEGMSPFRGLSNFEEEHSPLYFGREAEVDSFVEKLRHEPILPIIGPSGAGKSSFVKAGVIPRLRERGPLVLIHLRPGRDPFLSLASSLISAWRQSGFSTGSLGPMGNISGLQKAVADSTVSIGEPKDLATEIFQRPHQLGLLLNQLAERRRTHVVLFIDQLEELCAIDQKKEQLPQHSESSQQESGEGVLGRFMHAIACAADDPQMPVRVILTLREEFLTRLMTSKKVREALDRIMVLRKPSQRTLVTIMERTVKAVGYRFEEFHLPHELVDDVKTVQACLPLLQFACQVMWQNRDEQRRVLTTKAYREMNGVTGALVQHAEGVLAGLTAQEVSLAKKILLRLVTEDKTRRIMSQQELLLGLQIEAQGVLEKLVESRLVTISRKKEEEKGECELVHEALVSNWKRLNNWLDENREEIGLLNQIEQAARLWEKRGRRIDDLWNKQALKESAVVLDQAISRWTVTADFVTASERQIRRGQYRVALVFGLLIIALIATAWAGNHFLRGQLCTGAEEEVGSVWNEQVKQAISESFVGTGVFYAQDTVVRVTKIVDDYTNSWKSHYTKACEATHVKGDQSGEILDLRMGCLRKRKGELGALLRVFSTADSGVVQKAVQASSSLTNIKICADLNALRATYPPPKTSENKRKVDALRERLAEIEALSSTGKYDKGLELVKKLEQSANAVNYQPVIAEVMYHLGELLYKSGDYKTAEMTFYNCASIAAANRDVYLVANAMARLVFIVGYRQARFDAGLSLSRACEFILRFAGGDETVRARLLNYLGILFWRKGVFDKAMNYYQKSLSIMEKQQRKTNPNVASLLNNMGIVLKDQKEYSKSMKYFDQALAIRKKLLGSKHPEVAHSLNNIGNLYYLQNMYDEANKYYQNSLTLIKQALGPEHLDVAQSLNNLGLVYCKTGQYDQALDYHRKALALREKSLGFEHPLVAESLTNMSDVLLSKGILRETLVFLERSRLICTKKSCQTDIHAQGLFNLARCLVATSGDRARAISLAHKARVILGKVPNVSKQKLEAISTWLKENSVQ